MTYSESPARATISHDNTVNLDFTVPQDTTLGGLGANLITVTAEVTHFTDSSKASTTTITGQFDFTIFFEPCQVTNYVDTTRVTQILYQLGTPDLTDGYYEFDEVPTYCGYPETVTFSPVLPSWITHNVANSDFTVPSNGDLSLIGTYTYNIQS